MGATHGQVENANQFQRKAEFSEDVRFDGSTTADYLKWTQSTGKLTLGGASSSTSGSAKALTSSATSVFGVYADDGGTAIGASAVRAGQFRTLVTCSHSAEVSVFGSQSQLKIKPVLDTTLTSGNRAGSWNYLEMAGTATKTITLSGSQKATAACFGMVEWDGVGALTLSSGHTLGAFVALTNVVSSGGTFTQTGKFAAFAAVNNATASYSKFRYGLYIPMESAVEGFRIGESSSSADGSGIPLSATYTAAARIHADTGSAALRASNTRAFHARYLIGTAPTAGANVSAYGVQAHLRTIANINVIGNVAGLFGYFEPSGSITLTNDTTRCLSGVASQIDIPTGVTLAAGAVASAYGVNPCDFAGTTTGRMTVMHVTNPTSFATAPFDSFLELANATGCEAAGHVHDSGGSDVLSDRVLKVYVNGTIYYIPMFDTLG